MRFAVGDRALLTPKCYAPRRPNTSPPRRSNASRARPFAGGQRECAKPGIEEMHEKGEPLERALPDAGIERIRPVMITVGATILALFPLALEGGPLWKPLCYAQIGGLAVATFITLLLVPVFYSIFVLDLKWIKWQTTGNGPEAGKT
jgi:hypothetical protein